MVSPLEPGFATFCSQSQRGAMSIQDQLSGPLSQLHLRQGDVSATEKTREMGQRCLQSPVREELFHFLGDWQCQHLVGGEETSEGFPA